jgi:hypothetical protein
LVNASLLLGSALDTYISCLAGGAACAVGVGLVAMFRPLAGHRARGPVQVPTEDASAHPDV